MLLPVCRVHKIAFIIIIQFEYETAWLPSRHKWIWFNWIDDAAAAKLGQTPIDRASGVHTSGSIWWSSVFFFAFLFSRSFIMRIILTYSCCRLYPFFGHIIHSRLLICRCIWGPLLNEDKKMQQILAQFGCGVRCTARAFLMHNSFRMNNAATLRWFCVRSALCVLCMHRNTTNSCYYYYYKVF